MAVEERTYPYAAMIGNCQEWSRCSGSPAATWDGGRVKSFKSAEARSTGEAGKPWARRVPNRGSGEPVHHESSDRALAECVSTMRISAGRNPEPETSGGEWKDLQCDPDLSPAALLSPRSSLPQRTAAVPHCERLSCNDCRGEKTPART